MKQEFQWSRSLMVVLLTVLPKYWKRLPWRLRLQFLFSELWYPLFGSTMLCGLVLPIAAVLSKEPWVRVNYLQFLLHITPPLTLMLAIHVFLRRQGWLRPHDSPTFTWEGGLFQLVRWPWAVYGTLMGIGVALRRRNVVARVTPKGSGHLVSLPWKLLFPYAAVVGVTFLPALLVEEAGPAQGYFFFLILSQIIYVSVLFSIILIHRHEMEKDNR